MIGLKNRLIKFLNYQFILLILSYQGVDCCPSKCVCVKTLVCCSHKNLQDVPSDIDASTTDLNLSYNQLSHLRNFTFSHLKKLRFLNLCYNRISIIDSYAFDGLVKLRVLNLTVNKLNELSSNAFTDLQSLKHLFLKNNRLTEIPQLFNLTKLINLDMSGNSITRALFPPSFQLLKALDTVKLSENNLGQISASDLEHLPAKRIMTFDCRACNLTKLNGTDTFSRFVSLLYVDLGKNNFNRSQLSVLIESLSAAHRLAQLKLIQIINGYNLPSGFFTPFKHVKLKSLSLSYSRNYGTLVDNTFTSLKFLKILQIKEAAITFIASKAFEGLDSLQHLYLDYVGVSFQNYPQLETLFPPSLLTLSLSGNSMSKIIKPQTFNSLLNLTTLYLKKCDIYGVDYRAFALGNNLQILDLSYNFIHEFDKFNSTSLSRLSNLTTLYLTGNDLNEIISRENGDLLEHLVKLNTLQLSKNNLDILPVNFFNNQIYLSTLDLNENNIKTWNSNLFYPLKRLTKLFMKKNKIQVISNESIQYWKALKTLNLEGNPFNCGCDSLWFLQWIRLTKVKISYVNETYFCGSPNFYKNVKLWDVNLQELQKSCSPIPLILYISAASAVTLFVIIFSIAVIYRFQWYLKWYCYRCCHGSFVQDEEYLSLLSTKYFVFLSYHQNEELWADEFVEKLEAKRASEERLNKRNSEQSSSHNISTNKLPDAENNCDSEQELSHDMPSLNAAKNRIIIAANIANTSEVETFAQSVHSIESNIPVNFGNQHENNSGQKTEINHDRGNEIDAGQENEVSDNYESDENTEHKALLSEGRQRKSILNQTNQKISDPAKDNPLVYYEKRCLPNKSRFEEAAKAIYSCKFVIVYLSAAYLRDRRFQFELDLIQTAMTERYGYDAFSHIIFLTNEPTGELMNLIPEQLRGVVDKSCILWSTTNEMQQNYFWEKLNEKINV